MPTKLRYCQPCDADTHPNRQDTTECSKCGQGYKGPRPTIAPHTPGPWRVDSTRRLLVMAGVIGPSVCELFQSRDKQSRAEARANARLIAAAPEMLGSLRAIAPMFNNDSPLLTVYRAEIERAEALLSRLEA